MRTNTACVLAMILSVALMAALCPNQVLAYNPCFVPPVVGSAVRPNVILDMDYSGNMALPAYLTTTVDPSNANNYYLPSTNPSYVLDATGPSGGANSYPADYSQQTGTVGPSIHQPYDPTQTYYGIFNTDGYYVYDPVNHYFKLAPISPVTSFTVTDSSDGGTTTQTQGGATITNYYIIFTVSAPVTYNVGDYAVFSNLPSNTSLNGNAYQVTAVSGSTFTVLTMTTQQVGTNNPTVNTPPYAAKFNGASDAPKSGIPNGTVAKRINTGMDFLAGISGNILNFMTMSRMDAAMKALIGGREQYPHTAGDNYYVTGIASRWFGDFGGSAVTGTGLNLNAGFYVRPATLVDPTSGQTSYYPDNFSTGSVLGTSTSSPGDQTIVTVFGSFSGALTNNSTKISNAPSDGWKFTVPFNAFVKITLQGAASGADWTKNGATLTLYSDKNWHTQVATQTSTNSGLVTLGAAPSGYASWGQGVQLAAGTYYVQVTFNKASGLSQTFKDPYSLYANVNLAPDTSATPGNTQGQALSAIGAIPFADVRIAVPEATWPSLRTGTTSCGQAGVALNTCPRGLVQDTFNMVRWGFMFFNSWVASGGGAKKTFKGKMLVGCENRDLPLLLRAMQGIPVGNANYPYNDPNLIVDYGNAFTFGTPPTGVSITEIADYLQGANNNKGADNHWFNGAYLCPSTAPGGIVMDPYFDAGCQPVPCRKTFTLLIATGTNSDNPDPSIAASQIHGIDMRPDNQWPTLPGIQDCKIYGVYAFGTDCGGRNAMRSMSAWGGFTSSGSCGSISAGKPWTWQSTSPDSTKDCWPRTTAPATGAPDCSTCNNFGTGNCNPSGTYDSCCSEWSTPAYWDRNNLGISQFKGVPDNYYEASQGSQLVTALQQVLHDIVAVNAAASSVATVSQQVKGEGDVIVRGAFRATDPDNLSRYLWFGHLEAFWPDTTNNNKYDFEYPCNAGLFCFQMPGSAVIGGTSSSCPSNRPPYCWDASKYMTDPSDLGLPRTIFTGWDSKGDGRIKSDYSASPPIVDQLSFDTTNWSLLQTPPPLNLNTSMNDVDNSGTISETDVQTFIQWIRGAENSFYRSRVDEFGNDWPCGDIVYSSPVIQSFPGLGAVAPNQCSCCATTEYWNYRNLAISRQTGRTTPPANIHDCVKQMVYVGANDGMVHAIVLGVWDWGTGKWHFQKDLSDPYAKYVGEELWAYIPSNLLSELKYLADATNYGQGKCPHRSMVDLSENVWQVYIKSDCTMRNANGNTVSYGANSDPTDCPGNTGKCWRSVIIGGERGGGDVYFAIDVTDPDYPRLLWEYSVIKDLLTCDPKKGTFSLAYPTSGSNPPYNYDFLKTLPLTWSKPQVGRVALPGNATLYSGNPDSSGNPTGPVTDPNPRYLAFIGSGFRVFENPLQNNNPLVSNIPAYNLAPLQAPNLLAIDMDTGKNVFKYVWPYLVAKLAPSTDWAVQQGGYSGAPLPYAMSDPVLLDLWNSSTNTMGNDGFVDHLYIGDLTGNFYGIKFYFDSSKTQQGLFVDLRKTMPGQSREVCCGNKNCNSLFSDFIGQLQPITVQPAASIDQTDTTLLHIIFGTGKFDDTIASPYGGGNDKSDPVRMSIYNLADKIDLSGNMSSKTYSYAGQIAGSSNFWVYVNKVANCSTFNSPPCVWRKPDGSADCCQSNCTGSCWSCIFDLTLPEGNFAGGSCGNPPGAAERVVNKALIAGGLLFVTTYVPPTAPCDLTGQGYLYIFDYMCTNPKTIDFTKVIPNNTPSQTFTYTAASGQATYGVQVSMGPGVPSQPVLDSSGQNVIMQLSNASLLKVPVTLPQKQTQETGWRER